MPARKSNSDHRRTQIQISARDRETIQRLIAQCGRQFVIRYVRRLPLKEPKRRGAGRRPSLRQAFFVALYRARKWDSIREAANKISEAIEIEHAARRKDGGWLSANWKHSTAEAIQKDLERGLRSVKDDKLFQNQVAFLNKQIANIVPSKSPSSFSVTFLASQTRARVKDQHAFSLLLRGPSAKK